MTNPADGHTKVTNPIENARQELLKEAVHRDGDAFWAEGNNTGQASLYRARATYLRVVAEALPSKVYLSALWRTIARAAYEVTSWDTKAGLLSEAEIIASWIGEDDEMRKRHF